MPASTDYDPSLPPQNCPITAAKTKKGMYLKSRCERTLARNITGMGICMHANHLSENFFVFIRIYPKGRFTATVNKKTNIRGANLDSKAI